MSPIVATGIGLVIVSGVLIVWLWQVARKKEEKRRLAEAEIEDLEYLVNTGELPQEEDEDLTDLVPKSERPPKESQAAQATPVLAEEPSQLPMEWDLHRLKDPDVFHPLFDPVAIQIVGQRVIDRLSLRWVEGSGYPRRACLFVIPSPKCFRVLTKAASYSVSWQSFAVKGKPVQRLVIEPESPEILAILETDVPVPAELPETAALEGYFDPTDPEKLSMLEDLLCHPNYILVCSAPQIGTTTFWDEVPAAEQAQTLINQLQEVLTADLKQTTDFAAVVAELTSTQPVVAPSLLTLILQGRKEAS